MTSHIMLSNGEICFVDDADFAELSAYKWHALRAKHTTYAYRGEKRGGKQTNTLMHRQILNAPKGVKVDHKSGRGLDNQRENIRLATNTQNSANAIARRGTSTYKGVSWHKRSNRWRAVTKVGGRHLHIGAFVDEVAAAMAYDRTARKLFGDFACVNFPADGERQA